MFFIDEIQMPQVIMTKSYVCNDSPSHSEVVIIAANSEQEAEAAFQEMVKIERPTSEYDCTGKPFTGRYDLIGITQGHVTGRGPISFFFYNHQVSLDL